MVNWFSWTLKRWKYLLLHTVCFVWFVARRKRIQDLSVAQCTCCKKISKHDLHVSGTTHLNRHAGTHSKVSTSQQTPTKSQAKITGFVTSKKVLSQADVAALRTSSAYFCAADLRPFSAVQGSGFQHLAQTLIGIGSRYGNINVKDILRLVKWSGFIRTMPFCTICK